MITFLGSKKIPSTADQSLSCLYHESFSLANNKIIIILVLHISAVLQFAFSLIEEISKVGILILYLSAYWDSF